MRLLNVKTINQTSHGARKAIDNLGRMVLELAELKNQGKLVDARNKAAQIAKSASSLGIYQSAVTAYRYLSEYYTYTDPNKNLFNRYTEKLHYYENLLQHETEVRKFILDICSVLDRKITIHPDALIKANSYVKKAKEYESNHNHGPYFYYKYYMLLCLERSLDMDYPSVLGLAEKAYDYFNDQFLDFHISRYHFLVTQGDAHYSMQNFESAKSCIKILDTMNGENTAGNNCKLLEARIGIIEDNDISHLINDEYNSSKAIQRHLELCGLYDQLNRGIPIEHWGHVKEYFNDPTGYGVALRIAQLWNAHLNGTVIDIKDNIKRYVYNNKPDDRSVLVMDSFIRGEFYKEHLEGTKFNPHIEIIPYEILFDKLNRA